MTTGHHHVIELLCKLIRTPSLSGQENITANIIADYLHQHGITTQRYGNNIVAGNDKDAKGKPVVLLNSHHDTVRPADHWSSDPLVPTIINGKITGLGSNDAGGALVALITTYIELHNKDLPFHLILVASAEEENSGHNGIESVLPHLPEIYCGIVGEPTLMNAAVAERGLMVLDCVAHGVSGHAARDEGRNAIVEAIDDINWFHSFRFPEISEWLGEVKMTATIINAGTLHNVIPGECRFTVDVRVTDVYTHEEILSTIRANVKSKVTPRSLRMRSSRIETEHPLVKAVVACGKHLYGSPTSSDQALMNFPTLKTGPGDSARSHTADEFIYADEIINGIRDYKSILHHLADELRTSEPQFKATEIIAS
jgi:acetylornithine deacetylase